MITSRRLSLTLLIVTPLVAVAQEVDYGSKEAQPPSADYYYPYQDQDQGQDSGEVPAEDGGSSEVLSWSRRRRALDSPGGDLVTAEQVLFRPLFRYRQIVEDRKERQRLREKKRRHSEQPSATSAAGPTSSHPAAPALHSDVYYHQPSSPTASASVPRPARHTAPHSPQRKVYSYQQPAGQSPYHATAMGAVFNPHVYSYRYPYYRY